MNEQYRLVVEPGPFTRFVGDMMYLRFEKPAEFIAPDFVIAPSVKPVLAHIFNPDAPVERREDYLEI